MRIALIAAGLLAAASVPPAVTAAAAPAESGGALARELLARGVGFATVKGRGQTEAYANYLKAELVKGGWAADEVTVTPVAGTATLHAVWKGGGKAKPMALIGHMDVVEADPKDWTRDPFTLVEADGYLFGRGVLDDKFGTSTMLAALIEMRRSGFRSGRDIHVFLSGDEETVGETAAIQAKQAKAAGVVLVINNDAGGGELDDAGKPLGYGLQVSEKTYADYTLTVTDPGGHSSRPTASNAIATLAAGTQKIAAYQFPPQINDVTRAAMLAQAGHDDKISRAMVAYAKNPADSVAIATLSADPGSVGMIRTTCVPTMVSGGHAPNALPQRAALTVNCRIFPGTSVKAVRDTLATVVGDPRVTVAATQEWTWTDASPLDPKVLAAVTKAVQQRFPGLTPTPAQESGATDGVYYRALGIPTYGADGLFMRSADVFAHGLNERVPAAAVAPAVRYWQTLVTELAR